jgi:hypothetical protein
MSAADIFMPKKGDRVEWTNVKENKVEVGTVSGVRMGRVTVVLDGGEFKVSGPARIFRPSSVPLPVDPPSPMDKWAVKSYKCIGGDETPMFTCKITLDGKVVGHASNRGCGGEDEIHFNEKSLWDVFERDTQVWWKQFGGRDTFAVGDLWIDWVATRKRVGETAAAYIADYNGLFEGDK